MNFTNQEKQERFRRKEGLKKIADEIFRDWQFMSGFDLPKDSKAVRAKLDQIADLPSGWNDEDYQQAKKSFNTFKNELFSRNPHLLQNDIFAGRDSICTLDERLSVKMVREQNNAVWQAKKLVSHLNSAMDLAGGCNSDHAAVVLELARSIGVSLLNERITPKSNATAICLLVANPTHKKPEWLIGEIARILQEQLGEDGANQLAKTLTGQGASSETVTE